MKNYKLTIEYDGSRYQGWQASAEKVKKNISSVGRGEAREITSISEKIEEVLEKMENKPVELIGAIRTEAGVHAYAQIANAKIETTKKCYEIKQYLNRYLPRDIAVLDVEEAEERFHAAFNAKGFTFEYHITLGEVPSVFDRKYNYYCFKRPDVEKIREAAKLITGEHDLAAFSDNKRMKKSTVRRIDLIDVYANETELQFTVEADDFWPNMARIIIASLLEVGLDKITIGDFKSAVEKKNREALPMAIDPKGLFLTEVRY